MSWKSFEKKVLLLQSTDEKEGARALDKLIAPIRPSKQGFLVIYDILTNLPFSQFMGPVNWVMPDKSPNHLRAVCKGV